MITTLKKMGALLSQQQMKKVLGGGRGGSCPSVALCNGVPLVCPIGTIECRLTSPTSAECIQAGVPGNGQSILVSCLVGPE
jgi:hypothetical protein